jgi:hypothetical protein
VHNSHLWNAFKSHNAILTTRVKRSRIFSEQTWKEREEQPSKAKLREAVYNELSKRADKFDGNTTSDVKVLPVVHGTSHDVIWQLVNGGMAKLSTLGKFNCFLKY